MALSHDPLAAAISHNPQLPSAFGLMLAYRAGWNDAANGALPTDCGYMPFQEDYELWQNGVRAYLLSKFNCEARRRFNAYRITPQFMPSEVFEDESDEDFKCTRLRYPDGSSCVVTAMFIHVELADGTVTATRPL